MSIDNRSSTGELLQELSQLLNDRLSRGDRRRLRCESSLELKAETLLDVVIGDTVTMGVLTKLATVKSCQLSAMRDALRIVRDGASVIESQQPEPDLVSQT
ncbi:MAG: hypothetical protein ABIQ04_00105 [Candidatus Saccharimonadales bacterium]